MRRINTDNPMPWLSIDKSKLNGININISLEDSFSRYYDSEIFITGDG